MSSYEVAENLSNNLPKSHKKIANRLLNKILKLENTCGNWQAIRIEGNPPSYMLFQYPDEEGGRFKFSLILNPDAKTFRFYTDFFSDKRPCHIIDVNLLNFYVDSNILNTSVYPLGVSLSPLNISNEPLVTCLNRITLSDEFNRKIDVAIAFSKIKNSSMDVLNDVIVSKIDPCTKSCIEVIIFDSNYDYSLVVAIDKLQFEMLIH